jgi:ATP-binding cassette subfamily F protein uup
VSHDRAFLDNVVTQVIAAEGDGRWSEYAGGYADWQRVRAEAAAREAEQARAAPPAAKAAPSAAPRGGAVRAARLSFNEKRELEQLPDRIAALEAEQSALQARLADPALYQEAPQEVTRCSARLEALEGEIEAAMQRWEELETRTAGS